MCRSGSARWEYNRRRDRAVRPPASPRVRRGRSLCFCCRFTETEDQSRADTATREIRARVHCPRPRRASFPGSSRAASAPAEVAAEERPRRLHHSLPRCAPVFDEKYVPSSISCGSDPTVDAQSRDIHRLREESALQFGDSPAAISPRSAGMSSRRARRWKKQEAWD